MLFGLSEACVLSCSQWHIWIVTRAASAEVTLQPIKSKWYPVLLYALGVYILDKEGNRSIGFTATSLFMKLFRTVNSEIMTNCQTFFGIESPSVSNVYTSRKTNYAIFVVRYKNMDNYICKLFK